MHVHVDANAVLQVRTCSSTLIASSGMHMTRSMVVANWLKCRYNNIVHICTYILYLLLANASAEAKERPANLEFLHQS